MIDSKSDRGNNNDITVKSTAKSIAETIKSSQ